MKFEMSEEGLEEDKMRKETLGETTDSRMARVCLGAMNAINPDLVFTVEVPGDFPDKMLPTLDFKIWFERNFMINHTYYQKDMKTPFVIMNKSAMGDHQKMSILANELVRRLSNANVGYLDHDEIIGIIETFAKEMKSSGYRYKHTREAVISGRKGWLNNQKRREKEDLPFGRTGKSTLVSRARKKLLEKESWYKTRKKEET